MEVFEKKSQSCSPLRQGQTKHSHILQEYFATRTAASADTPVIKFQLGRQSLELGRRHFGVSNCPRNRGRRRPVGNPGWSGYQNPCDKSEDKIFSQVGICCDTTMGKTQTSRVQTVWSTRLEGSDGSTPLIMGKV
jgi:hypothetical protein